MIYNSVKGQDPKVESLCHVRYTPLKLIFSWENQTFFTSGSNAYLGNKTVETTSKSLFLMNSGPYLSYIIKKKKIFLVTQSQYLAMWTDKRLGIQQLLVSSSQRLTSSFSNFACLRSAATFFFLLKLNCASSSAFSNFLFFSSYSPTSSPEVLISSKNWVLSLGFFNEIDSTVPFQKR